MRVRTNIRGGPIAGRHGRRTSAGASTTRSPRPASRPLRAPHRSTGIGASPTTRRSSSTTTFPCDEMLRISHLVLARGARRLLDDVDLTIHAGHKVGVVGANGSGKSSLFAAIRGEISPEAGAIEVPAA